MARIAIVGGVQSVVMFTGFAARGHTVTVRAIFHESGVVRHSYRAEKCHGALVTNLASGCRWQVLS